MTASPTPENIMLTDSADLTTRFAYSPAEAAALLGITRKHIYTLMHRGELQSKLIGRCRRIPRTEVERLAGIAGDAA
jgi:excisionase family DNA binding protein